MFIYLNIYDLLLLTVKPLPFIVSEKSPNFSHTIRNFYSKVFTGGKVWIYNFIYMWPSDCSGHVILQPFPRDRIQLYSMIYYWHYKNNKYSELVIVMKSISSENDVWLKKKFNLFLYLSHAYSYNRVLHHRDLDIVQTKFMIGSAETYTSVKLLNTVTKYLNFFRY